jgi:hypothetical protein
MVAKRSMRSAPVTRPLVRVVPAPPRSTYWPPRDYRWHYRRGARVCTRWGVYGTVLDRAIHYGSPLPDGREWYAEYLVVHEGGAKREWLPEGDLEHARAIRLRRAETLDRLLARLRRDL